ncbi:MAG: response regulator transcription factor [Acidobacteriota bacterium]
MTTPTSARVLLIDDDVELLALHREVLETEGFDVALAADGASGLEALREAPDIVVLDVMMPGIDGVETLRRIRRESTVPVLMLTARGDDVDRIVGLELGADDYVPKPCTPRELVARLRAILRRVGGGAHLDESAPLDAGALRVEPAARRVVWREQPLELTSTEFNLLEELARHAGRVVTKDELSERALGRKLTRYDRSIDVHMSHLRAKLGPLNDGRSPIQTVRGVGYQLVAEPR